MLSWGQFWRLEVLAGSGASDEKPPVPNRQDLRKRVAGAALRKCRIGLTSPSRSLWRATLENRCLSLGFPRGNGSHLRRLGQPI